LPAAPASLSFVFAMDFLPSVGSETGQACFARVPICRWVGGYPFGLAVNLSAWQSHA
jgi:hypothetical protein